VSNITGRLQGEDLARAAQEQNTNLQHLIDAVGVLIAASRSLLMRLELVEGHAKGRGGRGSSDASARTQLPPEARK
jgi:hypothetical protein